MCSFLRPDNRSCPVFLGADKTHDDLHSKDGMALSTVSYQKSPRFGSWNEMLDSHTIGDHLSATFTQYPASGIDPSCADCGVQSRRQNLQLGWSHLFGCPDFSVEPPMTELDITNFGSNPNNRGARMCWLPHAVTPFQAEWFIHGNYYFHPRAKQ